MHLGSFSFSVISAFLAGTALAATPAQWRSRSVYFLLTDRFARSDGSTTAACDTSARVCSFILASFILLEI